MIDFRKAVYVLKVFDVQYFSVENIRSLALYLFAHAMPYKINAKLVFTTLIFHRIQENSRNETVKIWFGCKHVIIEPLSYTILWVGEYIPSSEISQPRFIIAIRDNLSEYFLVICEFYVIYNLTFTKFNDRILRSFTQRISFIQHHKEIFSPFCCDKPNFGSNFL